MAVVREAEAGGRRQRPRVHDHGPSRFLRAGQAGAHLPLLDRIFTRVGAMATAPAAPAAPRTSQVDLFALGEHPVLTRLKELDLAGLTPLWRR